MNEIMLHQRETEDNTESFLQENIGEFKRDLDFVLMLMKNGKRLTAKSLVQEYGIADRRLRDAYLNRESILKQTGWEVIREWRMNETGKRKVVEYYMKQTFPPNKTELIQKADAVIQTMKEVAPVLETIFELPDDEPHYSQQTLFP